MSLTKQLLFTKKLIHLYKSGQPILRCLESIVENERNKFLRDAFQEIIGEIQDGKSFANALRNYEDIFGSAYINLIHIGEKTGKLDSVLIRLKEYLEGTISVRNKVISASVYPIVLILVYVGLFIILLAGLIFMGMKFLPTSPLWVFINPVSICCFVPLALLLTILLIYIFWSATNLGFLGDIKERVILLVPGIGSLFKLSNLFSYLFTMKICYDSGVSTYESVDLSLSNVNSSFLYMQLEEATKKIKEGTPVSLALSQTNLFNYEVIQLLRVGEESGTLDSAYQDSISIINDNIDKNLSIMIALIKPAGILFGLLMLGTIFCGVFSFVIIYIKTALSGIGVK